LSSTLNGAAFRDVRGARRAENTTQGGLCKVAGRRFNSFSGALALLCEDGVAAMLFEQEDAQKHDETERAAQRVPLPRRPRNELQHERHKRQQQAHAHDFKVDAVGELHHRVAKEGARVDEAEHGGAEWTR